MMDEEPFEVGYCGPEKYWRLVQHATGQLVRLDAT